jgi:hypothetical protein
LESAPTYISLTPFSSETVGAFISSRNDSSFTISLPGTVTQNREIGWQAESGRQMGTELVSNQDVEVGSVDPDSWFKSVQGASWVASEFRSGAKSLHLSVSGSSADWRANHFSVNGLREYKVRTFVKGSGDANTFLTIRWFSDAAGNNFISENNIVLNNSYSTWTEAVNDFVSPATAQSADIMFRVTGSAVADLYADEFSVRVKN